MFLPNSIGQNTVGQQIRVSHQIINQLLEGLGLRNKFVNNKMISYFR